MRLNKYEKEWIERLMSGKSVKHKGKLFSPNKNSNCCLGVAARVCGVDGKDKYVASLSNYPDVTNKIRINNSGRIDMSRVKQKWKKYFDSKGINYNLISLNDDTNMTHKQIGEFINENRSAVFIKA